MGSREPRYTTVTRTRRARRRTWRTRRARTGTKTRTRWATGCQTRTGRTRARTEPGDEDWRLEPGQETWGEPGRGGGLETRRNTKVKLQN